MSKRLTYSELKKLVLESRQYEREEFFFDHAELCPDPVETTTTDAFGRKLEKTYDKIFVYETPDRKPYYIWTKFGNGKKLTAELNKKFAGKTVSAKMLFDGGTTYHISSVGIRVVEPIEDEKPKQKPEAKPAKETPKEPEQLELPLFEGTKVTLTFGQLRKLVSESLDDGDWKFCVAVIKGKYDSAYYFNELNAPKGDISAEKIHGGNFDGMWEGHCRFMFRKDAEKCMAWLEERQRKTRSRVTRSRGEIYPAEKRYVVISRDEWERNHYSDAELEVWD